MKNNDSRRISADLREGGLMSIYDLLAITVTGALGFVLGVVTTIKVDSTHERMKRHGR